MATSILVVPSTTNDTLLRGGTHGARMPVALRFSDGWRPAPDIGSLGWREPRALILAWEGVIADEGCDRLSRLTDLAPLQRYSIAHARILAYRFVARFRGDVVVLDAEDVVID